MRFQQKKILYALLPFIGIIVSLVLLNVISQLEPDPLDAEWTTRQLIIGLFIFTSFSFIPKFLHLSVLYSYPWITVNLSHHPSSQEDHELTFKGKSICTGCLGSTMSIILANSNLILYFYFPSIFNVINTSTLFITGFILIMITYSRYFVNLTPKFRLIQHLFLFFGISFLIITEDIIFQSAFLMVLLLPSWISFLLVRVKLSKLDHTLE